MFGGNCLNREAVQMGQLCGDSTMADVLLVGCAHQRFCWQLLLPILLSCWERCFKLDIFVTFCCFYFFYLFS